MKIPEPFDLISMVDEMELKETRQYYRGWLMYDMEVRPANVSLRLWKMSYTINLMIDEGIVTAMSKKHGDGDYVYYVRKIRDDFVSDSVISQAEIVSNKTKRPQLPRGDEE